MLRTALLLSVALGSTALTSNDALAADSTPLGSMPVQGDSVGRPPGPPQAMPETRNPLGNDAPVLQDGRRLFVWYNCYGCHGGRAGGGMGPSLRDATWLYGNEDEDIFASIAQGRSKGMPAWGTTLTAEEIWKITAYIQSLGSDREPDAPPPNPVYPDPPPHQNTPSSARTDEADQS